MEAEVFVLFSIFIWFARISKSTVGDVSGRRILRNMYD